MDIGVWEDGKWRVVHPDVAISRVCGAQFGTIATWQLRTCGLTDRAIAGRVRAGRLHRVHRGVFLVGHAVPPQRAREAAALLAAGPHATLSHTTAAALLTLLPQAQPGPVHVTVGRGHPRSRKGIRVHRARIQGARRAHGLPVTSPAQTISDLPPLLRERAQAEAERLGLVAPEPETRLTRSEAERRLLALLRRAGIPPDATNVRIAGHEVDAVYREARLIIEMDGYAFHHHRDAFEHDRLRDADLQSHGVRVLRVTWRQIADEPEAALVRVARLLHTDP